MKARHASEVSAQKTVWRQLAAEREKVWSDYRKEFATPEPQQGKASQQQSHRDEFQEAASGTTRAEEKRFQAHSRQPAFHGTDGWTAVVHRGGALVQAAANSPY
jgi:hypothetical protein